VGEASSCCWRVFLVYAFNEPERKRRDMEETKAARPVVVAVLVVKDLCWSQSLTGALLYAMIIEWCIEITSIHRGRIVLGSAGNISTLSPYTRLTQESL